MSNNRSILKIADLRVEYHQNRHRILVLRGISFCLQKGEILSLVGESGSGKSTIAKAITGILPPSAHVTSGSLRLGEDFHVDLSRDSAPWKKIRGSTLSMIFQDAQLALNPLMTVKEHFREVLLFHKAAMPREVIPISSRLLSLLNFSDIRNVLDSYPFQLSGGMCQRICIALSLCLNPAVLIADEPTSALDTVSQKEVLDLIKNIQENFNLAVLLITHDIAVANGVSDRVIVLNKGVVEETGSTKKVFSCPQTAYTRQLLASRSMGGIAVPGDSTGAVPVLDVIKLEKYYVRGRRVLNNLNFTLHEREIIGILGQSGCGKSTLAKCILGLESPSRGAIMFRGRNIAGLKGASKREVCKRIQMVFQDARASLNPRYTAVQLVQEPLDYLHIGKKNERKNKALYFLDQVGIDDTAKKRRPPQLSTGQCQRIAIARALIMEPEILVCDEAVSALDMQVQAQILELLQGLYEKFEFSIIMISHDIRVLRQFCHQVAVMESGSFSQIDHTDALTDSQDTHTRLLLDCEYRI